MDAAESHGTNWRCPRDCPSPRRPVMNGYTLSHLTDHTLLQALASLVTQDHVTTAALLAHLAEVDERKLYLPAAYPSMFMFCVQELRMSEDAALMRIRAARAARQFPAV